MNRAREEYIARIDALGGMLRAIETGYVQGEIQKAAYEYQRAIERGEQIIVGVNQFVAEKETSIPTMRVDPELERAQIERLRAAARPPRFRACGESRRRSRAPRADRRKLDARHRRSRRGLRHRRRNFRRHAARFWRIHGVRSSLSLWRRLQPVGLSVCKAKPTQRKQAAEKMTYSVILSEAKNLSSIEVQENKQREILRFAQNDSVLSFSAACKACATPTAWPALARRI